MMTDLSKPQLRRQMKARRAEISPEIRAEKSRRAVERLLGSDPDDVLQRWFVYISFRDELDTRFLINTLRAERRQVFVPRTANDNLMEAVLFTGWDELQKDQHGFLAPAPDAPALNIDVHPLDVCVCPGLAFTARGDRLGYGQGHYDRFLAARPRLFVVGLCFDEQLVDAIPTESTDRAMDWIVTDQRTIDCRA